MKLSEITRLLDSLGSAPTRSLGQNFLHDQNLARWIVSRLDLEPGDHVVEIGPGLGALTETLVESGVGMTLIEKDTRLVPYLRERFGEAGADVIQGDAAALDPLRLLGRGRLKILGNLPYYASTPILARYADPLLGPERLVFTLQREVADRLAAVPGTKAYGAMTVCVGRRWKVERIRDLPPSVFHPRPKVESAVVVIRPRPASEVPLCDEEFFVRLVRAGFSERRKQAGKLLRTFCTDWAEAAAAIGVAETARAEEFSVDQWTRLANLLRRPASAQSADEHFDVVDENDRPIGPLPRDEVHARDLRHRAVHVLVTGSDGRVLLQKRSIWKDRNPGYWDSSTAGHVDAGESYEAAARREMREEIGIDVRELAEVGKLGCGPETGNEFLKVFTATHDGPFRFAPGEVEGGAFFSLEHVRDWLGRCPEDFTPIFRMAFPMAFGDPRIGLRSGQDAGEAARRAGGSDRR